MLRPLVTIVLLGYKFKSLFSTWGSAVCALPMNPLAFTGVKYNFMDLFAAMLLSPKDMTEQFPPRSPVLLRHVLTRLTGAYSLQQWLFSSIDVFFIFILPVFLSTDVCVFVLSLFTWKLCFLSILLISLTSLCLIELMKYIVCVCHF